MKLNGLEKYFKTENDGIVDFTQITSNRLTKLTPLMFALKNNKSENLNLSSEQWNYLIKKSDLMQFDSLSFSALMFAFRYNKEENLNFSENQFDYLIKNSDLKKINIAGWSILMCALEHNKSEIFNCSNENWKFILEHSDLSLIKNKDHLITLKKIQSKLLNDKIMSKIDIKEEIIKVKKI